MRVFSEVGAIGRLHIGNYFGAIKQWLHLQKDPANTCVWMISDLHSLSQRLPTLRTSSAANP